MIEPTKILDDRIKADFVETPRSKIKAKYNLNTPSPSIKMKTKVDERYMRILSALGHDDYFKRGEEMRGKSLGIHFMRRVYSEGRKLQLITKPFNEEKGLNLYFKNEKGSKVWYRGHPKTGYEKKVGNLRFHDDSEQYCPFQHCSLFEQRVAEKEVPLTNSVLIAPASLSKSDDGEPSITIPRDDLRSPNLSRPEESSQRNTSQEQLDANIPEEAPVPDVENNFLLGDPPVSHSHYHAEKLQCPHCEYKSTHLANLKRHARNKHRNFTSDELKIAGVKVQCDECGMFLLPQNMSRHKKENKFCLETRIKYKKNSAPPIDISDITQRRVDKRYGPFPFCMKELRLDSHIPRCSLNPQNRGDIVSPAMKTNCESQSEASKTEGSWKFSKGVSAKFKNERIKDADKTLKEEVLKNLVLASMAGLMETEHSHTDLTSKVEYSKDEETLIVSNNCGRLSKDILMNLSLGAMVEDVPKSLREVFFSAFSIASKMEIEMSEKDEENLVSWSSKGKKRFTIRERPRLSEGLRIILKLKEGVTLKKKLLREEVPIKHIISQPILLQFCFVQ